MKRIFLLFIFLVLSSCRANPENMFKRHVSDSPSLQPKVLYFHRESSALHGPLFFKFELTPQEIEQLVHKHALTDVSAVPAFVATLGDMANKEVAWWPTSSALDSMKRYLVLYNPKNGSGDWQMRFLAIEGDWAYFITTGNFDMEDYVVDPKRGMN